MAEWLAEDEQSRPQAEPIITEEQLRHIFGVGSAKTQRDLGAEDLRHHLLGVQMATSAAIELVKLLQFPASAVGRLMDLRNLDTELEAIKQHTIATRCLSAELRKRV